MDALDFHNRSVAYEGMLELPTYGIKGENPNPVFRSQYGVAQIYPYSMLDHIDQHPTLKEYHTLYLENRFLRVTILPNLGGRVYSVFDKISNSEVFYKNKVIKFSPLAVRGAFFSGGIEFSFPVAHAPTTADSVNWDIRNNNDGSASISVGGIEHMARLRWMITLTLYPERCALAQDVVLSNPYFLPGRFHYWTNASLEADDQTEFIYPFQRMRSYEFAGCASWPSARLDLIQQDPGLPGMEGTPKWPVEHLHNPINLHWQKNILTHLSLFGKDIRWNFFGAWQHSKNIGYVHYADHHDVAGMKLWSWGNAPIGVVNQSALTDDGSLYAETQCGAMETQLDFDFLDPFTSKSWREWWIPLRQIQGFTCASSELGANIKLIPGVAEDDYKLLLAICPTRIIKDVNIKLSISGEKFLDEISDLSPIQPWMTLREVDTRHLGDKPFHLIIQDVNGVSLLDYTIDSGANLNLETSKKTEQFLPTTLDAFQQGLYYEKLDQRETAIKYYLKAIEGYPNHPQANFRLGLLYLRAADFGKASGFLQTSLANQVEEAHYYLSFAESQLGNADHAIENLKAIEETYPPTQILLSGYELSDKQYSQAVSTLSKLPERYINQSIIQTLLGIAYRKAGEPDKAIQHLQTANQIDPLQHIALRELALLIPEVAYKDTLSRMLRDDYQYILDLACFYIGFGLLEDALQVLQEYGQDFPTPLIGYLGYWLSEQTSHQKETEIWRQRVLNGKPDMVFPSRIEEINALHYFLKKFPEDSKAKAYIGTFYYARQRYDEAIQLWLEAAKDLTDSDVLFRNLGWAMWKYKNQIPAAIDYFERALALNPLNQDLYIHLDDLYQQVNDVQKRLQLLEKIKILSDPREDIRKRSILMRVELGLHEEALVIMQSETFVPLEMDQTFHEVYVQAYLQLAEDHRRSGQIESAIADYLKALEYPRNLGVGQPVDLKQAQIYYLLGLTYEQNGQYKKALKAWHRAAEEHHSSHSDLYPFVLAALDKINHYSKLGLEIDP